MNITEPIRKKHQVEQLISYYDKRGETRNYVLISLCVHTALRISDILKLNCNDVYDFKNRKIRKSITITESKTGKSKIVALNKAIIRALSSYLPKANPNTPLILNDRTNKAISRIQAYRLIRTAAESINIPHTVSCHSLRKTFGYHAWKSGTSPAVIMEIYNHSSLAVTRRYLGVTQDDKNEVYINLKFTM